MWHSRLMIYAYNNMSATGNPFALKAGVGVGTQNTSPNLQEHAVSNDKDTKAFKVMKHCFEAKNVRQSWLGAVYCLRVGVWGSFVQWSFVQSSQ